jgi:hypothetical protein
VIEGTLEAVEHALARPGDGVDHEVASCVGPLNRNWYTTDW